MGLGFLDTNIILRYITRDDTQLAERARCILKQVETGTLAITTCEGVIVETVQVLSSRSLYNLPRSEIHRHLSAVLRLRGLKLPHKHAYLRALELYVSHTFLDFVDALSIAHMERQQIAEIFSFDRDFDRISSISRKDM